MSFHSTEQTDEIQTDEDPTSPCSESQGGGDSTFRVIDSPLEARRSEATAKEVDELYRVIW